MEHSIAIMSDDVAREARRGDFLYAVLRDYAPHLTNDIDAQLALSYPRARHRVVVDDDTRQLTVEAAA